MLFVFDPTVIKKRFSANITMNLISLENIRRAFIQDWIINENILDRIARPVEVITLNKEPNSNKKGAI